MEEIEFREESEEQQQKEDSIREIVLRQIRKIGDICNQEFTEGYWQKKPYKLQGGVIFSEEYHQDTREAYCNSVDFIIDLVYALSDKDFKKLIDDENQKTYEELDKKLKAKMKIFREINIMFDRVGFFEGSDTVDD